MDDTDRSLLMNMLVVADRYEAGEIGLRDLANNLEGLLNAGEFRDARFREEWWEAFSIIDEVLAERECLREEGITDDSAGLEELQQGLSIFRTVITKFYDSTGVIDEHLR